MSYDPDNIFTKIIAGDIPSHKVYEDDVCISIMDIMPEAPGHVLVVPKKRFTQSARCGSGCAGWPDQAGAKDWQCGEKKP